MLEGENKKRKDLFVRANPDMRERLEFLRPYFGSEAKTIAKSLKFTEAMLKIVILNEGKIVDKNGEDLTYLVKLILGE